MYGVRAITTFGGMASASGTASNRSSWLEQNTPSDRAPDTGTSSEAK